MFTSRTFFFNKEGHFKAVVNLLFHSFHFSLFHMKAQVHIHTERSHFELESAYSEVKHSVTTLTLLNEMLILKPSIKMAGRRVCVGLV